MLDVVLIAWLLVAAVFPIAYCFYRGLGNKVLFLFAVYGAELVIESLLAAAALPAIVFVIFGLPQLKELGIELMPLGIAANFMAEHSWQVLPSLLLTVLPPMVARRYRAYFEIAENT